MSSVHQSSSPTTSVPTSSQTHPFVQFQRYLSPYILRRGYELWQNNDGWLVANFFSNWNGVACDYDKDKPFPISINLPFNKLEGTIIWEISQFQLLGEINLNDIRFYGTIPPQLGSLSSLQTLRIDVNDLVNMSVGQAIPVEVANTKLLGYLESPIHDNNLTGTVPQVVCVGVDIIVADYPGEVACSCCRVCYTAP